MKFSRALPIVLLFLAVQPLAAQDMPLSQVLIDEYSNVLPSDATTGFFMIVRVIMQHMCSGTSSLASRSSL